MYPDLESSLNLMVCLPLTLVPLGTLVVYLKHLTFIGLLPLFPRFSTTSWVSYTIMTLGPLFGTVPFPLYTIRNILRQIIYGMYKMSMYLVS